MLKPGTGSSLLARAACGAGVCDGAHARRRLAGRGEPLRQDARDRLRGGAASRRPRRRALRGRRLRAPVRVRTRLLRRHHRQGAVHRDRLARVHGRGGRVPAGRARLHQAQRRHRPSGVPRRVRVPVRHPQEGDHRMRRRRAVRRRAKRARRAVRLFSRVRRAPRVDSRDVPRSERCRAAVRAHHAGALETSPLDLRVAHVQRRRRVALRARRDFRRAKTQMAARLFPTLARRLREDERAPRGSSRARAVGGRHETTNGDRFGRRLRHYADSLERAVCDRRVRARVRVARV